MALKNSSFDTTLILALFLVSPSLLAGNGMQDAYAFIGFTPLHIAVHKNRPDEVKRLIQSTTTDINARSVTGKTALGWAVEHANDNTYLMCALLIQGGADINIENEFEISPVYAAAWFKHVEIVELLLNHGARVPEDRMQRFIELVQKALGEQNPEHFPAIHAMILKYTFKCLENLQFLH